MLMPPQSRKSNSTFPTPTTLTPLKISSDWRQPLEKTIERRSQTHPANAGRTDLHRRRRDRHRVVSFDDSWQATAGRRAGGRPEDGDRQGAGKLTANKADSSSVL